jgi:putative membrane protein
VGCFLRLVVALATNALALWVCDRLFDGVQIQGFWAYFLGAAVLGLANAIIKPVLALLTLPLVLLTLGLFYFLIAIGMVALTAWVVPNFSVHGFWDYVGVVFIVWLVNWAVGALLDRSKALDVAT